MVSSGSWYVTARMLRLAGVRLTALQRLTVTPINDGAGDISGRLPPADGFVMPCGWVISR